MNCKNCDKKFHYCSSCDFDEVSDEGYCSLECYVDGSKEKVEKLSCFWKSLNKYQKQVLEEEFECCQDILFQHVKENNNA